MAKKTLGGAERPERKPKKTSIGKTNATVSKRSMNKSKARSYKKYRGQGR